MEIHPIGRLAKKCFNVDPFGALPILLGLLVGALSGLGTGQSLLVPGLDRLGLFVALDDPLLELTALHELVGQGLGVGDADGARGFAGFAKRLCNLV